MSVIGWLVAVAVISSALVMALGLARAAARGDRRADVVSIEAAKRRREALARATEAARREAGA